MNTQINIIKRSGEIIPYSSEKIKRSLERSGADHEVINKVIQKLNDAVYDGITSKKIHQLTHKYLSQYSSVQSSKYKLKQAIIELGPSGYPFEHLVGEILKAMGFTVQVGIIMQGKCVKHEVDVFAEKGNLQYIVECKFHNRAGYKSDVKVPLYISARFKDIENALNPTQNGKTMNGWVVTNTRFTLDAIDYGICAGLKMMSWDYPENASLKTVMTNLDLHPITSLDSLKKREKELLIEKGVILCRSVLENKELLSSILNDESKYKRVLDQVKSICGTTIPH